MGQEEEEGSVMEDRRTESRIESGRKMQEGSGRGGREGPLVWMERRKGIRRGKRKNIISSMTRQKKESGSGIGEMGEGCPQWK